ncbi:granulocyte-macrophage colony-stimulating factor receptor subunit alpha-like [Hippopotamus amphibius kiboko]|uniref:granulocyte-macrophage colony-stimulating factor receptor subunit alpha-like n=1 Tax=Hippopotamus amphibius kiboko TaxID=575201 RepID=UPI0025999A53|nr:granulocyte-macrophage colony-stimulating factor receptor subunit alpha-like [Hippopotamus amphibius kiboko]
MLEMPPDTEILYPENEDSTPRNSPPGNGSPPPPPTSDSETSFGLRHDAPKPGKETRPSHFHVVPLMGHQLISASVGKNLGTRKHKSGRGGTSGAPGLSQPSPGRPEGWSLTRLRRASASPGTREAEERCSSKSGPERLPRPPGSPAGPLATAVLLSVLLDPALVLTQNQDADLPTVDPNSSLNVRFDPKTAKLTWDCKENTTDGQCVLIHKERGQIKKKVKDKECECTFQDCTLHGGVTLTVEINVNRRHVSETLVYTNPGGEGTAAQNFSCLIYDADFMNCTWAKGQAAPEDVQYFLYVRSRKKIERECPRYLRDAGTHVGCHLQNLSGLASYSYFLVNGTSQETGIQFFDSFLLLKEIEQYNPPNNISVYCNESYCLIQWEKPRTRRTLSNREFQYQLDIQRQSNTGSDRNQLIVVSGDSGNKYDFPRPGSRAKHTVQMRTSDARKAHWGTWSQPVVFGSEEPESSLLHVYLLAVLGTLICGLTVGCLFKRFLGTPRLFPPIPQIKDKLNDNREVDHQILWEKFTHDARKGEKEEILTVQEVAEAPANG